MPVSKPTPGATGWNVAVDAVIDIANAVEDLPTRVDALEAGGGDVTEAELAAGLATKAATIHNHAEFITQDNGDNRYILQTNAGAFASDTELSAGLATKASSADVLSLNGRVNELEVAPPAHAHTIGDITAPGTRDDTTFLRGDGTFAQPPAGTGGGVTDHGALTGLTDDDHTQYHTDARGDVRYYTKAQVDTTTAGLTPTTRTVTAGAGLTGGGDLTANRTLAVAYGTVTGTAAQGNDTRITGAAQKSANLSDLASASTARSNLGLGSVDNVSVNALMPTMLRPTSRPSRGTQTILSSFATGHGWTSNAIGTINLNDTSDHALGSQSVSIVTSGGGNVGGQRSEITKSAIPTFDMTNKTLRLWFKTVSSTNLDRVRVGVGTDASNLFLVDAVFPVGHANSLTPDGRWSVIDFDMAGGSVIGAPTRTACTWAMIRVTDTGGGNTANVRIGGLALVDKPPVSLYPNGVITIGFDDGYVDQYTNARAKMDEYGFAATCYVIQDLIGTNPATYMSATQLRELEDLSGWEIAAHSATVANHNTAGAFTSLTDAALKAELESHKTWMLANGFRGADHFAYPQGAWSDATVAIVRQYFATARTITPPGYQSPTPAESQRMRVYPINVGTPATTLNAMVDQVKANRSWLQVYTHRVLPSGAAGTQIDTTTFNTFIDYIAAQGVAVRTVGGVLTGA